MITSIKIIFQNNKKLAFLNACLLVFIVLLNFLFQLFCIPVLWVLIVIVITFTNTIIYPLSEKTKLAPVIAFINGISLFCIVLIFCSHWMI